jgi:hypothetical protein
MLAFSRRADPWFLALTVNVMISPCRGADGDIVRLPREMSAPPVSSISRVRALLPSFSSGISESGSAMALTSNVPGVALEVFHDISCHM